LLGSREALENISIKDARFRGTRVPAGGIVIPQAALINFIRRASNLQWFRSDLTPENVKILGNERPDITFVS
jgi:hypothetical protein